MFTSELPEQVRDQVRDRALTVERSMKADLSLVRRGHLPLSEANTQADLHNLSMFVKQSKCDHVFTGLAEKLTMKTISCHKCRAVFLSGYRKCFVWRDGSVQLRMKEHVHIANA